MHIINEGTVCVFDNPSPNIYVENRPGGRVFLFNGNNPENYGAPYLLPVPNTRADSEISILSGNTVNLNAPENPCGFIANLMNWLDYFF